MIAESVAVEEALLFLKVAFLVLLYLFIWRIVRTASRDLRTPQESFILTPGAMPRPPQEPPSAQGGRLVVVASPALAAGAEWALDSTTVTYGRSYENEIVLRVDVIVAAWKDR